MKNLTIKESLIRSILLTGIFAVTLFAVGSVKANDKDDCDKQCRKDLARARAATAKYHDVNEALEDGFINTGQCVEVPGLGAMGVHFVRPDRIGNPSVNVSEPEALLYLPDEDGEYRLVGLEYVVPAALTATAPTLFGQAFHYNPMRNEYALHVWTWRHNPSGMFADFNPKLSCPGS